MNIQKAINLKFLPSSGFIQTFFFSFLVKLMKSTRASVFDIKVNKCTVYKTKIFLCFFACDAYKSEGFSVYRLRTHALDI